MNGHQNTFYKSLARRFPATASIIHQAIITLCTDEFVVFVYASTETMVMRVFLFLVWDSQ